MSRYKKIAKTSRKKDEERYARGSTKSLGERALSDTWAGSYETISNTLSIEVEIGSKKEKQRGLSNLAAREGSS
jgi:hypothetical protein